MPQTTELFDTPRYVLKSGSQTIFPTIRIDDPDTNCVCVYGFSDKANYDKFIESIEQLLTPFPLVKGYLVNQVAEIENGGAHLAIVILNATSLEDPILSAATMAIVLHAHQEKTKQVQSEYWLVFDPDTNEYRFENDDMPIPKTAPHYIVSNP